ncbi:protein PIN-LIKES 4 isoform X2 [Medicago truncatula]|uniref:Auxin efflux carrier family protein n=1 Tax=Medicago truncatula TaxID=3880 RepID=A0A072TLW0_MEDTR|nr:protein PIN-LIKES 4 isoform X2 [Medicago truncatula]KEH17833.1 auxin efflux carrier family protein [Medicago truncatula]
MEFLKLFIVALMPVLKVLLITVLGTFLALDRFDILSRETARKNLNTIVFFVFAPALVCGSLAETVTSKSIVTLWFMPLNVLLTFIIGAALGWLVVKLMRVPHHLQGLVLGCCAAGNLGNLPLIIVPAVCKQTGNPFGDADICHRNGLAYASLSMAVSKKEKIMKQVKVLAEKMKLKALFAPATIGALVGLLIGVVPIFRKMLIVNNAPLGVIQDSLVMVGDAGIPAMTLLVGANLIKGLKGLGKQVPIVVGIIVVRFIILPVIGIGIVKGAIHFGLIHPDPLYQFLLLLQFALPPAVALSTITQLFGVSEGECSVIMLATYSCAAFSLTLWSTFFMWLVL